jgi:hypothetical protein
VLLALPLLLLLTFLLYVLLFDFFMLSIYLFLSFLLLFFLIYGLGLRVTIFVIVVVLVHLLVLDFNADILVEFFISLNEVRDLAEHVRLNLQLHELLSEVLQCEVIAQFVPLLLQFLLETLWLVRVVKDDL